jgi:hypothetical protein
MAIKEFTLKEAQNHIRNKGNKQGRFYVNFYGWQVYYTLEPTFATPTGKAKGFPRTRTIKLTDKK